VNTSIKLFFMLLTPFHLKTHKGWSGGSETATRTAGRISLERVLY